MDTTFAPNKRQADLAGTLFIFKRIINWYLKYILQYKNIPAQG